MKNVRIEVVAVGQAVVVLAHAPEGGTGVAYADLSGKEPSRRLLAAVTAAKRRLRADNQPVAPTVPSLVIWASDRGMAREERLAWSETVLGRSVRTWSELTKDELRQLAKAANQEQE